MTIGRVAQALRHRLSRVAYDALRELGFVPTQRDGRRRGWPGEKCKRCGRRNVLGFLVPDAVWMAVVGDSCGCWCLTCFDEEAQAKGIAYRVRPEDLAQVSWDMWGDFAGWGEQGDPMTVSARLLQRAENAEVFAREADEVAERLRLELETETNPALRVSLEVRIRTRTADAEHERRKAREYREAAALAKGVEDAE